MICLTKKYDSTIYITFLNIDNYTWIEIIGIFEIYNLLKSWEHTINYAL